MPEVNTRFEQLFHGDVSQTTSFVVCILRSRSNSGLLSRPRTLEHGKNDSEPLSGEELVVNVSRLQSFKVSDVAVKL
jgi:hypothetical protein